MKKINKKLKFAMIFLIGILFAFNFVSALSSYSRSNPQYTSFDYTGSGEFESFNSEMCREGQDFIIQIAPGGCTPAIVRSDLLEEQNVPVFCQLSATQINPLIKVEAIKSISFTDRELSRDVASVNFHPSRAALSLDQRTNFQPMMDNIGYVVLTLKQNPNESALENCEDAKLLGLDVGEVCWVEGNLTARIFYDIENAYGIGAASFYLPEMNDADWEDKYTQYGFWDGRGFLRAESVGSDQATISIYSGRISSSNFNSGDARQRVSTVTLQKGELSPRVYLPNFDYCLGNFQLRLTGLENPDTRARLNINGQIIEVAEREKFLENRCEVKKLSKKGLVQDVEIYCREDDGGKTISFTISPKINLTIDGNTRQVNVGDQLFPSENGKFVYLAYAGTADGSTALENLEIRLLAIPENKNPLSGEEIVEAAELARNLQWNVKEGGNAIFQNIGQFGGKIFGNLKRAKNWFVDGENFGKVKYGTSEKVYDHEIEINNFAGPQNDVLYEDALEYYKNALDDYDSLETSYAGEKIDNSALEVYGENALDAKIQLAKAMGQERDMIEFCKEFEENYPDSKKPLSVCTNAYLLSSSSSKEISVLINGRLKSISFENIYEPSKNEYSAELLIRNSDGKTTPITLAKDQIVYLDDTSTDFIQLISLEQDSAKLMVSIQKSGFQETKDIFIGGERVLQKDIPNSFGSAYNFVLEEVNLKQAAKISVIPNINNQETSSEFKFKVGVEKRSDLFKLSPEKTKDMIKALDKNLKTWEDISKTLTTTVETMKSACLLTGITLTFKNLISNAGGQGIARYNVMRGHGGWYEKCTDIVNDKSNKITSIEQCFNVYEKNIEGDVDKMYEIMKVQNENIKETQKKYTTERILLNDILDTAGFGADFSKQVSGLLGKSKESVLNPRDSTKSITMKEISELLTQSALEENVYTLEQLRDIELYMKILEDPKSEPSLVAMAKENLYYIFEDIKANSKEYESSTLAKEESEKNGINTNFLPHTSIEKKVEVYEGATEPTGRGIIKEGDKVQGISFEHVMYYVILEDLGDNKYGIQNVTDLKGVWVGEEKTKLIRKSYSHFEKFDETTYKNGIKNAEVRYYETEPYKGLPAIVPFDLKEGWYAATKTSMPSLGGINAYDDSGRVSSFWLCNVGQNGLIEFNSKIKDDVCQQMNLGTGQTYGQFAGLSSSKVTKLVNQAVDAIREASNIAESNRKGNIRINKQLVSVGSPAVNIPEIQCQDFMSIKDCQILFNVCDPVICPSSRCDFGGSYPVQDVVQSGIVGSIALCLPNWNEGIKIPICLTGVKAGVDGWISVEKSYRDCLQDNLETGEMIGICEEIHSVYLCEFLWKQALPLTKVGLSRIMSFATGETNARGGAEYLGVANAWQNTQKAVDYFTQYYAENSFKAFQVRSVEEAGTSICKVALSATYPGGGNFFNSLIKADSPFQFNGNFEEIPFTTATNPPISQYKVYYHIYAGQDSGAYYQVYLRSGSGSSYYQDTAARRPVASGYVAVGDYASQTEDFTAPSGYKQLCIMVNGQEECGFKQVSTSFATDYIKDQYIKEQATQTDIKTTEECNSGTASVYSALNLNIQSGVEEAIDPKLYNRGVIRICATNAPDQGTDPASGTKSARWILIGACDDPQMGCWLDTKSVKDAVEFDSTAGEILEEVTKTYMEVLREEGDYLSDELFGQKIKEIDNEKDNLNKTKLVTEIINKVFLNNQKAKLFYLRGTAFGELAREYYKKQKDNGEKKDAEDDVFSVRELIEETLKPDFSKGLSPIFKLNDGRFFTEDLYFRYFEDGWRWSNDKIDWRNLELIPDNNFEEEKGEELIEDFEIKYVLDQMNLEVAEADALDQGTLTPEQDLSENNQKILSVLKDYSYEEGLKFFVAITYSGRGGLFGLTDPVLSSEGVVFSNDKIFRVKRSASTDLYLIYDIEKNFWKYSFGKVSSQGESGVWRPFNFLQKRSYEWQKVTMIDLSKTKWERETFFNIDKKLLSAIGGKNFYEGAIIIFGGEIKEVEKIEELGEEEEKNECLGLTQESCKIWGTAKDLVEAEHDTTRVLPSGEVDKSYVCARFTVEVLTKAGIKGFELPLIDYCSLDSVKNLLKEFDKRNDFEKIIDVTSFKKGDLVAFKWDESRQHITIFDHYAPDNLNHLFVYAEGGEDKPAIQQNYVLDVDGTILGAYRYVGGLNNEEISSQECWTLAEALLEVNKILTEYGNKKYSQSITIKSFVDKLFSCNIISQKEYDNIRNVDDGWFNGEENMEWIKKLLLGKPLTPGSGNAAL